MKTKGDDKKGSAWIWILVIVILIVIGIVIYMAVSGSFVPKPPALPDAGGAASGSSIPAPPGLPK